MANTRLRLVIGPSAGVPLFLPSVAVGHLRFTALALGSLIGFALASRGLGGGS